MEFFTSVYFVIFLCLIGVGLALLLCREIIRILTINKLREGKGRGPSHVCDLLCERFPEATVYKNVRFLKEDAAKEGLKCACDVVYVSRGGVGQFAPMNANFGIVEPLGYRVKGGKTAKNEKLAERALAVIDGIVAEQNNE